MNILALDLGTHTGYAYHIRGAGIRHGTETFRGEKSHPGTRWQEFRMWLHQIVDAEQIHLIAYEDVRRHNGTTAAHVYGGFRSMTEMVAQQHNVPMIGFGVGVVKKAWTGRGNADKQLMIEAARDRGFYPLDDNAADALAILHCALNSKEGAK